MLVWLVVLATISLVRAGYMSVGMTECVTTICAHADPRARQCNVSSVQWKGDEGPFHLLLTPVSTSCCWWAAKRTAPSARAAADPEVH